MRQLLLVVLVLAGCQKVDPEFCGNNPTDPRCTGDGGVGGDAGGFIIGGKVNMLSGAGLVLQNNGGDDKQILSSGPFTFATPLEMNAAYDVTVSVQPTNPSQNCVVTNGSGAATGDVTDVSVDCTTASYFVGGTVTGLATGTVTLVDNGTDMTTVGNGMFQFTNKVASGSTYTVTLGAGAPVACHVFGASGTIGNADVSTVVVNCNPNAHTIGGTITNLNGSLQLQDNGGDTITLTANGTYAFPTPIPTNAGYNVTVLAQPMYPPASQNCGPSPQTGTVGVTDVTNVDINCTTNAFHVGGSSTGVNGTIVLQNNGGDNVTQTASGPFTFATPVASGRSYAVTVSQTPLMLGCRVTKGTGTIANSDVMNVGVSCSYKDGGIKCGGSFCAAGNGAGCCDPEGGASCQMSAGSCSGKLYLPCDSSADCGGMQKCCVTQGGNGPHPNVASVSCAMSCAGPVLCDPNAPRCGMQQCKPYSLLPGYYSCQ